MEKKRTSPTKKSLSGILLMCMLAIALSLSGCFDPPPDPVSAPVVEEDKQLSAAEIAEKYGPAVVNIASLDGEGSGVIYKIKDGYGYIITNDHVIRHDNGSIGVKRVNLKDDREIKSDRIEIVGVDRRTDLAVIKIKAENLKAADFGDSNAVKAGEKVYAIGNPRGSKHDIDDGIIRTDEPETTSDAGETNINQYLKTSISLNPGNSGGPIFNEYGKIVAIADMVRRDAQNLNYAIPSNKAKEIAEELEKKGYVTWPYIGVNASNKVYKKSGNPCILVQDVMNDSPAAKAGIKRGDIIKGVGGIAVSNVAELRKKINDAKVGADVYVQIERGANIYNFQVKEIKELPKSDQMIDWS